MTASLRIWTMFLFALTAVTVAALGQQKDYEVKEVEMDLATLIPGKPMQIDVPTGAIINIRVTNRVANAQYRYKTEQEGRAPTGPRKMYEFTFFPKLPYSISPECEQLLKKAHSLNNESEASKFYQALEKATPPANCPFFRLLISRNELMNRASSITIGYQDAFKRRIVTVERFDPSSNAVLNSWSIELCGKPDTPKWRFRTEGEWLVGTIATDIVEIAAMALERPAPDIEVQTEDVHTYRISIKSWNGRDIAVLVKLSGSYLWSPEAFKPLAIALLGECSGKAASAAPDSSLAAALLEPTPEVISREDLRVSAALNRDLFSPDNHEQAALIISALALRESAGTFSDVRSLLCRLSTHLAFAQALRTKSSGSSTSGLWAEAALLTLVGRSADALVLADKMKSNAADKRWSAALHYRNTGDWRSFEKNSKPVFLEFREAFRALIVRRSHLDAMEMIRTVKAPITADWSRLLMIHQYPVSVANEIAPAAVALEVNEAGGVYKAYTGAETAPQQLFAKLNGKESRCVKITEGKRSASVLGWDNWRVFLRRHLLSALHEELRAQADMLGLHEDARETVLRQDANFSILEDYWRLLLIRPKIGEKDKSSAQATDENKTIDLCKQAAAAIRERPESILSNSWSLAYQTCRMERIKGSIPGAEFWHQPILPTGTLYDLQQRNYDNLTSHMTTAEFDGFDVRAPYDYDLAHILIVRKLGKNPIMAEVENILKPIMEYDMRAARELRWIAEDSGRNAGPYYEHLCAMDADECTDTSDWFAVHGDSARAIQYFERAFEKARDPLSVANSSNWAVDYYIDRGKKEDALRIAEYSADVYSYSGLATMGRLQERLGNYNEAISWYKKTEERYETTRALDEFYIRYQQRIGDARFAKEYAEAMKRVFPKGLEKAGYSDFHAPMSSGDGYAVDSNNIKIFKESGLRIGDVIVAADGYRVHNQKQWYAIRSFRDDPTVSYIIWRGGGYLQINGAYTKTKFGPPVSEKLAI